MSGRLELSELRKLGFGVWTSGYRSGRKWSWAHEWSLGLSWSLDFSVRGYVVQFRIRSLAWVPGLGFRI